MTMIIAAMAAKGTMKKTMEFGKNNQTRHFSQGLEVGTVSPMRVLGREWKKGEVLLADGAWGTEFFQRGLPPGHAPEDWNLSHPDRVREVARAYREAGSRIVLTNSFGGNRFTLEAHGLGDRVKEVNETAARLTAEAVGPGAVVAGDIGPSGKVLSIDPITPEELFQAFRDQAFALRDGGAQWIVVESMQDMEEMAIAVEAAKRATGLPVVASMTYALGAHGFRTMMGNAPEECVRRAEKAGADLIGANCGAGIDAYVPLAPLLRKLTHLPLWIKANAGIPRMEGGKTVYPLTPEQYASHVPALISAGVDVIGGCCGTTPRHIREVCRILAGY
jgi:5-methyltetrahydrofolate--homocysteine methyltransferase